MNCQVRHIFFKVSLLVLGCVKIHFETRASIRQRMVDELRSRGLRASAALREEVALRRGTVEAVEGEALVLRRPRPESVPGLNIRNPDSVDV